MWYILFTPLKDSPFAELNSSIKPQKGSALASREENDSIFLACSFTFSLSSEPQVDLHLSNKMYKFGILSSHLFERFSFQMTLSSLSIYLQ